MCVYVNRVIRLLSMAEFDVSKTTNVIMKTI